MNAPHLFTVPEPAAASHVPAASWRDGVLAPADEILAEEVPVAMVYNGISHAVMLASPQDLEDFAVGFSLAERIVRNPRDIHDIEVEESAHGITLSMQIAAGAMARFKQTRRARTGKTGCGLCGIDSLAWFEREASLLDPRDGGAHGVDGRLAPAALHRAMTALSAHQQLHHATGAAHAAGWAGWDGSILCVREDVGRHNALDKLIGALARDGVAPGSGFVVVTSRASFEMVQKAARAGIAILAAVSAPTAMAVRTAERAGVTLAGFVRGERHVVYSHPQRLTRTD
ncbi:formate dehydrogenase accessory sulfurtransferase FdhD [Massilia sp. YIM B02443]|uniref:formate dehydrogenase accessory sulfurtransferase FdhD n=1 Tax=Massilia sp. YIM B02443 TaxID=3050127 RepID=UPI0025B66F03|nr:formate dehydrogenase accessory sulfurtransferase FdhD [Massilia sp. YIM B02443]MDN4038778.1 formate dehydrogenase accessory sulfurtransferase FdhD [Massilia sp. YIM B02443]